MLNLLNTSLWTASLALLCSCLTDNVTEASLYMSSIVIVMLVSLLLACSTPLDTAHKENAGERV